MNSHIHAKALLVVLERCRELTAESEDSDWSSMDVADIVTVLDRSIARLRSSSLVSLAELRFLFVATSPLQEVSIDNRWGDDFLDLAERFDHLVGELP